MRGAGGREAEMEGGGAWMEKDHCIVFTILLLEGRGGEGRGGKRRGKRRGGRKGKGRGREEKGGEGREEKGKEDERKKEDQVMTREAISYLL